MPSTAEEEEGTTTESIRSGPGATTQRGFYYHFWFLPISHSVSTGLRSARNQFNCSNEDDGSRDINFDWDVCLGDNKPKEQTKDEKKSELNSTNVVVVASIDRSLVDCSILSPWNLRIFYIFSFIFLDDVVLQFVALGRCILCFGFGRRCLFCSPFILSLIYFIYSNLRSSKSTT